MSDARITALEEETAYLRKVVEELSDVIARQDLDLSKQAHRVKMLMEREAERELESGGSAIMTDQRPPHY